MVTLAADKWTRVGANVYQTLMDGRATRTAAAYGNDLRHFTLYLGLPNIAETVAMILRDGPGPAYGLAERYKGHLRPRLAAATINRRLAVLRAVARTAYYMGLIPWMLHVPSLAVTPYRDTSGPGRPAIRAMLAKSRERRDLIGYRDAAIIRLAYDLGLRREEITELDLEHADLKKPAVSIMGKGRAERQWLTLPLPTQEALGHYIALRGHEPGPLFRSAWRPGQGGRLTGDGLYAIVHRLGRAVGAHATPHGIRHTATTDAILCGRPLPEIQKFTRHRKLETIQAYFDRATDVAGQISAEIAATLG